MKKQIIWFALFLILTVANLYCQTGEQDSTSGKFYLGSSLMMLGNFVPEDTNPPDFIQLSVGYRINAKDIISVEVKTWKYAWPLGIPYGNSFQAPEEKYSGYVRAFGIGLMYQHFWWKGAYTSIEAMNMLQKYMREDKTLIQNGYQLFLTYRIGYHFQLFNNRFFIEPSIAMTHWPINTNVPESFTIVENKWSYYFLFEPGLNFGFKF